MQNEFKFYPNFWMNFYPKLSFWTTFYPFVLPFYPFARLLAFGPIRPGLSAMCAARHTPTELP